MRCRNIDYPPPELTSALYMRCAPGDLKILNVEMLQILRAPLHSHAPYVAGLSATLLSIAIEGGNVVLRLRIVWALVLIATIDALQFDLVEPLPQGGETAFSVSIVNPTANIVARRGRVEVEIIRHLRDFDVRIGLQRY